MMDPPQKRPVDHTARGCIAVLSKNGEPRISVSEWAEVVNSLIHQHKQFKFDPVTNGQPVQFE